MTTAGGLLSNRLRSIVVNNAQERWVATADGISVLSASNAHIVDHETVFILPPPDELNPITDLVIDAYGRIWAGVYVDYLVTVGGVSVYTDGVWDQYDESDGLAGPNVRRLAADANSIWVATSTGLTRISDINIGVEEREAASFRLSPNPASAFVDVSLDQAVSTTVEVLDSRGRIVIGARANGQRQRIDVSMLQPGLYLLRVGVQSVRFVVER